MYEVNRDENCLVSPVTLEQPCLVETSDVPSGTGTAACLVGPDRRTFIVDYYGFTEDIRGEGWEVFWLENPDSKAEHAWTDPVPESCSVAGDLLERADQDCEAHEANSEMCVPGGFGFPPKFVRYLPMCGRR
jgi:hypothetical protein